MCRANRNIGRSLRDLLPFPPSTPARPRPFREPFLRRPGRPARPVEAVEEGLADLVLFEENRYRLHLVDRGLPRPAALGIARERLLQLLGEAEVVDDETARLVAEDAVHPRDRLHQAVPTQELAKRFRDPGDPFRGSEAEPVMTRRACQRAGDRPGALRIADFLYNQPNGEGPGIVTNL